MPERNEPKTLKQKYEVCFMVTAHSFIPFYRSWGYTQTHDSLEKVEALLGAYSESPNKRFVREKETFAGNHIYTFKQYAHPNSPAARNPDFYSPDFVHIRVKPRLVTQ
jgi:hypothetical protein